MACLWVLAFGLAACSVERGSPPDEQFAKDKATVEKDLKALKDLLER
jgi:hypothetical protein